MSKETLEHLNSQTLIGFTDKRGNAWHYRADQQGDESNHYAGPIPVPDVQRRLFHWQAQSRPVAVETPAEMETMDHLSEEGEAVRWAVIDGRQGICRSDDNTGAVLGIFATGYAMHQYQTWLLETVANILDDDLSISSAGLLRGGAIAWVEVSVPENITTPEGVEFRPNLLCTTSFDGSIATTFKRTVTATVCDNTRELALGEPGQQYKVKHTRSSQARLAPAREALAMVHTLADDFAAEVAELCAIRVTGDEWASFLDRQVPLIDSKSGQPFSGRALSMADKKRGRLQELYRHDERVSPWAGTAYGVVQAINTYQHHDSAIRGAERPARNMLLAVTGQFGQLDRATWQTLSAVLAEAG